MLSLIFDGTPLSSERGVQFTPDYASGDTSACIFYLKARSGWIDKITVLEHHQKQDENWVHKMHHDQELAEGRAAHEYNVKIGQQVAQTARECLRILEMSDEELLACKDKIEAEFAESEMALTKQSAKPK